MPGEPTGDVVADAADRLQSTAVGPSVRVGLANLSGLTAKSPHSAAGQKDDEMLKWAALERLPTFDRLRTAIISKALEDGTFAPHEVDVTTLNTAERAKLVENALETHDQDNEILLTKLKQRLDQVGIQFPSVEVRFENIFVEAGVYVGSRALPTLPNFTRNMVESCLTYLRLRPSNKRKFPILHNVSGVLKPGRMTLLLGPPGAGKSTLMTALAGKLDEDLKFQGKITYNGHELHEFLPVRTAAYVSQNDVHIGELTVRETLDFSARVQGAGYKRDLGRELEKREKDAGIKPDPTMDAFMKGIAVEGAPSSVVTDYILKILGLEVCADTLVGNEMIRGISGGQKKRVTSGEMLVGPKQVLFADEISTGLDSSTTFSITNCLRHFTHLQDATVLIALLQPAPETYVLFDDVLLLAEGHVVFHGPREEIVDFFREQGFECPDRKGVADFLQEVTSVKDQEQYWSRVAPYKYVPVATFAEYFEATKRGQGIQTELATPFPKEKSHPDALIHEPYGLAQKELFKALFEREALLMKRNAFLYIAQIVQTIIVAFITMTVFFRTTIDSFDGNLGITNGNLFLGAIFFGLILMLFNGFAELSLLVMRLPVFYKQRSMSFFPAWAYAFPMWFLSFPFSLVASMAWVCMTYYVIGFAPGPGRFFRHLLMMFIIHNMAIQLFRLIAALGRTMVVANTFGSFALIICFVLGGFIIVKKDIHPWWIWGYWVSPLSYAQNALANNEFTAHRWQSRQAPLEATSGQIETLGNYIMHQRSFYIQGWYYWVGCGATFGFDLLFTALLPVFLKYLNPLGKPQPVVSEDFIEAKHAARTGENLMDKSSVRGTKRGSAGGSALDKFRQGSNLQQLSGLGAHSGLGMYQQKSGLGQKSGLNQQSTLSDGMAAQVAAQAADSLEAGESDRRGMILPFEPLSLSFDNVNYFVDMPAEMKAEGSTEDRLQLLRGVSGAFRPKVLTALVGVSGAGKTTLMDVLAGRKTGGYIEGDIRVSGYPKVQETFARISGYCEQNDIHTPQVTVHESLLYSAWLRLPKEVEKDVREEFVEEVMALVELDTLRDALVGLPGVTGLSTEQRKRLTIAVELVANPSIIFMDEPTSGLDARAAAIVMRTVRNTVDTGRTVVCTIHQPSIDIFEAFDELLLMKRGGQVIYMGPLGTNSQIMVDYFQSFEGVPRIKGGYNPATWMLEISAPAAAERLGVDFAELFRNSEQFRRNQELIDALKVPPEGHEDLHFDSKFSTTAWTQFYACVWKRSRMYWRAPDYNVVRYFFCIVIALLVGTVFWDLGKKTARQQDVLNIMGALYTAALFLGWSNASTVQPILAVERTIFYRERAAGMYSALPYAMAQGIIEIPYVLVQCILYSVITYATIQFEWKADKFFWYTLFMLLTLLFFTYYGMMAICITPNEQLAMVVSAFFFGLWNLFSGFIIQRPKIPPWWRWYYFINPVAWTLYGLIASQLGDYDDKIIKLPDGTEKSVTDWLKDFFEYKHSFLGVVVAIQVGFTITFFFIFAYALRTLNFQKR